MKAAGNVFRFNELQDGGDQMPESGFGKPVAYQPAPQQPVFIQPQANGKAAANDIHEHEEVDESLSIMDMEKNLIIKALKKHKGKRKDASSDLGISERTLYRKLKEYDIEE